MKTFTSIVLLLMSIILYGQTRPEHENKFYRASDGKLYVNKDIPLYFHVGDSKDIKTGNSFLLESLSTPKYSTPFFLDTEGYNTIRTPSKVDPETRKVIMPKTDVIFEIYADGIPPVSRIVYKSAPLFEKGGKLYIGKGLEIKLSARDKTSGLEQILYSINEEPFKKYTTPLKFDREQDYILKIYAVDNVGNTEMDKSLKFIPDYSAPVTDIELKTDYLEDIISPRTILTLTAEDNLSGVKFTLFNYNDGKNNYYQKFISPGWIGEGEHTLVYYSQDQVKNAESKKTFKFYMDKTPPEVSYEMVGDNYVSGEKKYISSRTMVRLKAVDNKAGVKEIYYSINGSKPQLYSEPFLLDVKAIHVNLRYYAIDKVNNSNKDKAYAGSGGLNLNIVRDEDPPKILLNYTLPNIIVNKMLYLRETSKISINASDVLSGVQKTTYVLDEVQNDYKGSFTVSKEGKHKIVYKAIDNANNESSESLSFYIDNTGPDINIQFGIGAIGSDTVDVGQIDVYPPKTAIFITATDQLVGYDKILYSVNGKAEVESKGVIKNLPIGEYKLKVRALDKLGNSNSKETAFIIRKEL